MVWGTVVDADGLDALKRLPHEGIKASGEVLLHLIAGNDDADLDVLLPGSHAKTLRTCEYARNHTNPPTPAAAKSGRAMTGEFCEQSAG